MLCRFPTPLILDDLNDLVTVNWAGVIAPAVSVLCLDSLAVSAMNVVLSTPYEVGVVRQMCSYPLASYVGESGLVRRCLELQPGT